MSGSGGGGGGGFVPVEEIACDRLRFETQIATPHPTGIAAVVVGDGLDVTLQLNAGQQVVALTKGTTPVGGLSGGQLPRLRHCMNSGTRYTATVISVSGPRVMVRIEPR
jgi:hypothetical protein